MNGNYPPGVTDADFIDPPEPAWKRIYDGYDGGLDDTNDLGDALASVRSRMNELSDLEIELEGYL